jgi:phospholipid/cholesterol/gamma-HCH transport system substrate-binding protein
METRANYVLIGAFTLATVVGAFLFVMWIAGYGTPGGHRTYQVVFNGSVSGLSNGANVLFNGIKVGEVTHLTFSRSDPHQVVADIDVGSDAPIDRNTKARLETQGLTGAAAVALLGGSAPGAELAGENGRPAVIYAEQTMQLQDILDNVAALSVKATSVLDDADKILADNSAPIHSAITNVEEFSKVLSDNAPNVNAALKSVADLGKTLGPLSTRLQTLSDDADRLVLSIDTDKVRSIVDNVQGVSGKANTALDQVDKLLAENSGSIHSTIGNLDLFAKALGDNASNVDAALKSLADLGKTIEPVAARIQTLSEDADRLVQSVEPDKVRSIVDNVQNLSGAANTVFDRADKILADNSDSIHSTLQNVDAFSKVLSDNSSNVDVTLKNLAEVSKTVQPAIAQFQTLSADADRLVQSVEPDKVHSIVDNVQSLSGTANIVFNRADKILADNSDSIRSTLQNVDNFSKVLSDNSPNVDVTLKNLAELSKTVQPVVAQIQTLSGDADRLVQSVEPDKVRSIVDNVQTLSGKANTVFDRADTLIAENSGPIHSTLLNVDAFSKVLSDNSSNVDVTLKNLADLSKTVQPVVAQVQTLSGDADRLVKSVEPDQVHAIVVNAETFSRSLADSSNDYRTLVRDGAALATHLNGTSTRLDTALIDVDGLLKAVDAHKIAGIVDAASDVAETVRQNRGNIDLTLKNFAELGAKLNESADKLDGLIASAQSFLGSPGTKGAVDQVSEAAQSVKKLADDVDVRVKEFSVGLNRFSNSGLREYEALAIEGRRTIDDIDRVVRSFERNPSQIIFGSKPSLPEYHGGQ